MTKKVTLIKSQFGKVGGAEKYASKLAHAFHNRGCEVVVLTTGTQEIDVPFEVISYPMKSRTSLGKVWEFEAHTSKYLSSYQSDIIFGCDRTTAQTHLRAGAGVHKAYLDRRVHFEPPLKTFRHKLNPLHSAQLFLEKKGFENPDLQVLYTNSRLVKDEILSYYVIDPSKIHVIHNGVEWREFEEPFSSWENHFNSNTYELLFVGNGFERKGLRALLHALAGLDLHLSVVGHDKNIRAFKKLTKKLGLEKQVTFFGPQKNVTPFYQQADCLVIPSHYDPFANVTTEALAMGLFVISSKTNGGHEVLTKETGTIIEDLSSTDSIISALKTAIKHPKTTKSAMEIRRSAKPLDFEKQLSCYLDTCLSIS